MKNSPIKSQIGARTYFLFGFISLSLVRTEEGFEWTTFGWWRENFAFKVAKLDFRRLFLGLGECTRELESDLGDKEAGVSALETEFGCSILPLRRCGRLYFIFYQS